MDLPSQYMLSFSAGEIMDYTVVLSNKAGEELKLGYRKNDNSYFIDRSHSGETDFNPSFIKPLTANRLGTKKSCSLTLVADASSIELFADGGLTNMTAVFFPSSGFDHLQIINSKGMLIRNLKVVPLRSIW